MNTKELKLETLTTSELKLETLTTSELHQINGGGWAYDLGKWVGDRMCDIKVGLNA